MTRGPPSRARLRTAVVVVVASLAGLGAAQLVPIRVTNSNARIEPRWDSPQTRQLVVVACFDCHSNQSRHVWYEELAPIKWWIAGHVDGGRSALNFDAWNRPQEGARRAGPSLSEGQMPPSYYTWFGLHADARLTAVQVKALVSGLDRTIANDPPPSGPAGAGDAQGGP